MATDGTAPTCPESYVRITPKETSMLRTLMSGLGAVTACAVLAACGNGVAGGTGASTPPELRSACGHPGAEVTLRHVPVTVPHAQCDLTGVVIRYGGIGVTVPSSGVAMGVADGPTTSPSLSASVDPKTKDVTIRA